MRRFRMLQGVAVVAAATVFFAAVATVVAWPSLQDLSATRVSYTAQVLFQENLLLDTYDTVSGIGFFRATAARLTRGLTTDDSRLEALMEWTNENVRPQYASPSRVVSDNSWELVRRGFGQCDQVNHILATLATYAGYDAQELFLWTTPQHTRSPHSVAEVLVKGRWVVVDAWQGIVWRGSDGALLTADDATPELMQRFGYTQWGIQAQWFKNGTPFRTFPYESPTAFVQKIFRKFGSVPVAPPISPPVPVATPSPTPPRSPSPGPARSPSPIPTPSVEGPDQVQLIAYDRARRAQLDGDYPGAASLYRALLMPALPSELRDSAHFWLGLSLLQSNQFAAAVTAFDAALAANPKTPWQASIYQYRAEAREHLDDPAGAIADYRSSNTPTSRARLTTLHVEPPELSPA